MNVKMYLVIECRPMYIITFFSLHRDFMQLVQMMKSFEFAKTVCKKVPIAGTILKVRKVI